GMDDNDADQYFIETAYHWSPTKSQRISVRYEWLQRDYDAREQRENDGTRIPGSHSSLNVHQLRLSHGWQWEMGAAKARWTQAARVRLDDDNGPGYDDLLRFDLQTRLE